MPLDDDSEFVNLLQTAGIPRAEVHPEVVNESELAVMKDYTKESYEKGDQFCSFEYIYAEGATRIRGPPAQAWFDEKNPPYPQTWQLENWPEFVLNSVVYNKPNSLIATVMYRTLVKNNFNTEEIADLLLLAYGRQATVDVFFMGKTRYWRLVLQAVPKHDSTVLNLIHMEFLSDIMRDLLNVSPTETNINRVLRGVGYIQEFSYETAIAVPRPPYLPAIEQLAKVLTALSVFGSLFVYNRSEKRNEKRKRSHAFLDAFAYSQDVPPQRLLVPIPGLGLAIQRTLGARNVVPPTRPNVSNKVGQAYSLNFQLKPGVQRLYDLPDGDGESKSNMPTPITGPEEKHVIQWITELRPQTAWQAFKSAMNLVLGTRIVIDSGELSAEEEEGIKDLQSITKPTMGSVDVGFPQLRSIVKKRMAEYTSILGEQNFETSKEMKDEVKDVIGGVVEQPQSPVEFDDILSEVKGRIRDSVDVPGEPDPVEGLDEMCEAEASNLVAEIKDVLSWTRTATRNDMNDALFYGYVAQRILQKGWHVTAEFDKKRALRQIQYSTSQFAGKVANNRIVQSAFSKPARERLRPSGETNLFRGLVDTGEKLGALAEEAKPLVYQTWDDAKNSSVSKTISDFAVSQLEALKSAATKFTNPDRELESASELVARHIAFYWRNKVTTISKEEWFDSLDGRGMELEEELGRIRDRTTPEVYEELHDWVKHETYLQANQIGRFAPEIGFIEQAFSAVMDRGDSLIEASSTLVALTKGRWNGEKEIRDTPGEQVADHPESLASLQEVHDSWKYDNVSWRYKLYVHNFGLEKKLRAIEQSMHEDELYMKKSMWHDEYTPKDKHLEAVHRFNSNKKRLLWVNRAITAKSVLLKVTFTLSPWNSPPSWHALDSLRKSLDDIHNRATEIYDDDVTIGEVLLELGKGSLEEADTALKLAADVRQRVEGVYEDSISRALMMRRFIRQSPEYVDSQLKLAVDLRNSPGRAKALALHKLPKELRHLVNTVDGTYGTHEQLLHAANDVLVAHGRGTSFEPYRPRIMGPVENPLSVPPTAAPALGGYRLIA